MGSDIYVHFPIENGLVTPAERLEPTAEDDDPGSGSADDRGARAIARLAPSGRPALGTAIELALDPAAVYLFDTETGDSLPSPAPGSRPVGPTSQSAALLVKSA
jgi:hypothetical protein